VRKIWSLPSTSWSQTRLPWSLKYATGLPWSAFTSSWMVRITGSFGCALITARAQAKLASDGRQSIASSNHWRPAARNTWYEL
jgi:hypothetical protein